MIIPIFLPHIGCSERCIYCNQGYITNAQDDNIANKINCALNVSTETFEVGLFGGNIFNVEPHFLERIFSYFRPYKDRITNFRISTKPVPLSNEVISILKANNVTVVELGMPTFNDKILQTLNRQHTVSEFLEAYYVLKNEGFDVAVQVMIGLPQETWDDIRHTADSIVRLKPYYIRIYPLVVLSGTVLATMYSDGSFIPVSFDEALDRATFIYLTALKDGIKTVKIGLTDNEVIKDKIVAGHYHAAFGYLVKSRVFCLAVKALVDLHKLTGNVVVRLNEKDIPHLVGYKRSNIMQLKNAGITVAWQKDDIREGDFAVESGSLRLTGNIFDALSFFKTA